MFNFSIIHPFQQFNGNEKTLPFAFVCEHFALNSESTGRACMHSNRSNANCCSALWPPHAESIRGAGECWTARALDDLSDLTDESIDCGRECKRALVCPWHSLSLDLLRKLEHPRLPGSAIHARNYLLYIFETAILNALLGSSPQPVGPGEREVLALVF